VIAFLAIYWPIILLVYVLVVLLILRVFQLGAEADDQVAHQIADLDCDETPWGDVVVVPRMLNGSAHRPIPSVKTPLDHSSVNLTGVNNHGS
jgi:hypothetical protein